MGTEIEIKLAADASALRQLPKLPIVSAHSLYPPVTRRLRSTYFDTPDLTLRQHGVAVRLRRAGRHSLQTVKREGASSGGLHQREEWEHQTAPNTLDFNVVDEPALRELLRKRSLQRELCAVFETDFRRTQRILRFGSDEIELCIDRGVVRTHAGEEPISEVELELKAGDTGRLFELAGALTQTLGVRLDARSKAERGYRLFTATPNAPRKAVAPALTAEMSAEAAFVAIVQSALAHLQANEGGLLLQASRRGFADNSVEYLHQMRVALRRLRSAIGIFGELIPAATSADAVAQLRWLAAELNDARDWDVFFYETLPPIMAAHASHTGLVWLRRQSNAFRRAAHLRARAVLASAGYQNLLLECARWLTTRPWRASVASDQLALPARAFAAAMLAKRERKLRKLGKYLTELDPTQRHRVRIAAKKLRYGADFCSNLFDVQAVRHYTRTLSKLQDSLGALNDAATSAPLLDALGAKLSLRTPQADRQQAIGLVLGWVSGVASLRLIESEHNWREFKDAAQFW